MGWDGWDGMDGVGWMEQKDGTQEWDGMDEPGGQDGRHKVCGGRQKLKRTKDHRKGTESAWRRSAELSRPVLAHAIHISY